MNEKECSDCKFIKSVNEFDKRNDRNYRPMAYCKECRKIRQQISNSQPEQQIKNKHRSTAYYENNSGQILVQNKAWRDSFKDLHGISYNSFRKQTDIQYKLRQNIRKRLYGALILNIRTPDLLGCSTLELKIHLENKFKLGMTWDNYGLGGWEIDHIKPLSSFDLTDSKQLIEVSNYKNLQPLWVSENRKKSASYKEVLNVI